MASLLKETDVKQNFATQFEKELLHQKLPSTENKDVGSFLFTVVRDPWRRLVSMYIEKFIYTKEYMFQCAVKTAWAKFNFVANFVMVVVVYYTNVFID